MNSCSVKYNCISLCIYIFYYILSGCSTLSESIETDIESGLTYFDIPTYVRTESKTSKGSLFNSKSSAGLFEDRRAYREGDVLTVILEEVTKSSKNTTSNVNKNNKISMPDPTLFGTLGAGIKALNPLSLAQLDKAQRNFSGAASTGQQNQISGQITVMVRHLLENGTLFVEGKKQVRLGQGDEIIYVSGFVRPEDISPDNRISSLRLADAKISYTAKGDGAESTIMGWMSRFFNSRWYPL